MIIDLISAVVVIVAGKVGALDLDLQRDHAGELPQVRPGPSRLVQTGGEGGGGAGPADVGVDQLQRRHHRLQAVVVALGYLSRK